MQYTTRTPALVALFFLLIFIGASATAFCETIGTVDTKFRMFSRDDDIVVEGFDDTEVGGVTCYLSRARKGGVKGMMGLAEDPSDASLECIQTGPISVPEKVAKKPNKAQKVFKNRTSLVFKSIQVVRFYDPKRGVLVYLVYSDRVIEGSPKNSVSCVKVK